MKRVILFFGLLTAACASAQLYVSPSSYVYVNDQVVYVKQDIKLQNTGNIYLRSEAQLLQGTTTTSTNTGLGNLSVFQEGTSNNYIYNYWCAPVGNAGASTGNENFGITMLQSPTAVARISNPAVIMSMAALDGLASPLSIAPRWIYKFQSGLNYANWILVGAASNLAAGEGFTMKGTSGSDGTLVNGVANNPGSAQRYDFRGKPNDGNISVNIGLNNLTLTGNPYPSALHVNEFLLDPTNTACDGTAYYWEQQNVASHILAQYQGGYGTYSPVSTVSFGVYLPAKFNTYDGAGNLSTVGTSSGLAIERKYAPIGQGFMIQGASNGSVTLKNSHRVYYKESGAYSEFHRAANSVETPNVGEINQVSHFRINAITNNEITTQIALVLLPEATDGIDRGIDAKSPVEADIPADVYFIIQNEKYVIEGVAFDVNKRIPIGVKSPNNSTFKFYVPEVINFDENQQIFIYDGLDGTYHNIKTGSFEITLDQGVYDNRFEVTFTDAALGVNPIKNDSFIVVQNNDSQTLNISNPDSIELKSCSLYDITGKLIFNKKQLGSETNYSFSTAGISEGIYIVKWITANNQDFGQKISVVRKNN